MRKSPARARVPALVLSAALLSAAATGWAQETAAEAPAEATAAAPREAALSAPQLPAAPPTEAEPTPTPRSSPPASSERETGPSERGTGTAPTGPSERETRPARIERSNAAAPPEPWTLRGVRTAEGLARELRLAEGVAELRAGRFGPAAHNALALMALGALGLLGLALPWLRPRSAVHVHIDYPAQLRGNFCVRLRRRPLRGGRHPRLASPYEAQRARRAARGSNATTHFDIGRETLLLGVPCRRWHLSVDGYLQTAEGVDVVATHFAEAEVRPRRGEPLRFCFDFQPDACPVELRVTWNQAGVEDAQVARRGDPGSLRFARGPVQLPLDRGHHVIGVGANDRVAELPIEIESYEPRRLEIDLGDRSRLVFSGCPRAVEPYLLGDVPAAAHALEREGQAEVAAALLARFHAGEERMTEAAEHYARAGEWSAAAEIREGLGEHAVAAELYERSGEEERAGECWRRAGQPQRAGECFLAAGACEAAADCFREAGDVPRWIEALTKLGRPFEAAKVALERGERAQAIQCLRRVEAGDADFPEAAVLLAESYEREGHTELARSALEELLAARPEPEVPCEAVDRLARLCETTGEIERAITLLEGLRRREPTWPHVATRVDALRKRRGTQTTRADDAASTLASARAFSEAFRYEILEELGRGGMGVVFRARDRRLGREVALKRLPDHIRNHPKAVDLFLREARAAASLNHPNIVTVHDAGEEGESFYITMELLRGQPLQKLLKRHGHLEPGFVVKLGGQVARGLQYAHEQGIVHRDVKTANLFFTEKKVVKIMDFGLAKMVEEVRRSSTVIGGTPYYMAPEQSAGEQVDHRSDLYALGVTLFELLAGRVPFREGDIAFHHRHTAPPGLRELAPQVPEPLAALVADLLVKRPADRVRSAKDVVRRLAAIARSL